MLLSTVGISRDEIFFWRAHTVSLTLDSLSFICPIIIDQFPLQAVFFLFVALAGEAVVFDL